MIVNDLIRRTYDDCMIYITDSDTGKYVILGQLKDLEDANNKAWKAVKKMDIVNFTINYSNLTIYV